MLLRPVRRAAVLGCALALVAAGCGDDDDDGEDAATTTEAPAGDDTTTTAGDGGGEGAEVVAVDFAFEGLPQELEAGVFEFTFDNQGEVDHEIAFVEIGDTPIEQFFEEFAPVIQEGAPFPEYAQSIVGANEAPPGESTSLAYTLPEGTYAAFCALTGTPEDPESEEAPPHFVSGMQQVVTVTAGDGGELPEADGTITASDYTFDADFSGGDRVINFINDGPDQVHFAGIDVMPEGVTPEQAEEAFATLISLEEGQEPPAGTPQSEEFAFSGVASEGNAIQFELPQSLESGRTYILYCFIQDRQGGPPHAIAYQMYKAFTAA